MKFPSLLESVTMSLQSESCGLDCLIKSVWISCVLQRMHEEVTEQVKHEHEFGSSVLYFLSAALTPYKMKSLAIQW